MRALGIDLGEARIGLALSDDLGMLAHPLETLSAKKGDPIPAIAGLVASKAVETVVVGLPLRMDGTRGTAAAKAEAFCARLRSAGIACPVILWDERMTTVDASRLLHEAGRNSKRQRAVIDQVAAQLILQDWLDAHAG